MLEMTAAFEKAFENFCDIYNSFVLFSSEYTQQINTLNELKKQIDDVDLLIQQSYRAYRLNNLDQVALEKFEWHNHHKRLLEGQMAGVTDTCNWLIERYGVKMGWVVADQPPLSEEHASVESDFKNLDKTTPKCHVTSVQAESSCGAQFDEQFGSLQIFEHSMPIRSSNAPGTPELVDLITPPMTNSHHSVRSPEMRENLELLAPTQLSHIPESKGFEDIFSSPILINPSKPPEKGSFNVDISHPPTELSVQSESVKSLNANFSPLLAGSSVRRKKKKLFDADTSLLTDPPIGLNDNVVNINPPSDSTDLISMPTNKVVNANVSSLSSETSSVPKEQLKSSNSNNARKKKKLFNSDTSALSTKSLSMSNVESTDAKTLPIHEDSSLVPNDNFVPGNILSEATESSISPKQKLTHISASSLVDQPPVKLKGRKSLNVKNLVKSTDRLIPKKKGKSLDIKVSPVSRNSPVRRRKEKSLITKVSEASNEPPIASKEKLMDISIPQVSKSLLSKSKKSKSLITDVSKTSKKSSINKKEKLANVTTSKACKYSSSKSKKSRSSIANVSTASNESSIVKKGKLVNINTPQGSAVTSHTPKTNKTSDVNRSSIPSHPLIRSKKKKVLTVSTPPIFSDPSILQETAVNVEISTSSLPIEPKIVEEAQASLDQQNSSRLPENLNPEISLSSQSPAGQPEIPNSIEQTEAVRSPIQRRHSTRLVTTPKDLPDTKKRNKLEVYCICRRTAFGEMIACDCKTCPYEWFHYECVSISEPPPGKWFCSNCKKRNRS